MKPKAQLCPSRPLTFICRDKIVTSKVTAQARGVLGAREGGSLGRREVRGNGVGKERLQKKLRIGPDYGPKKLTISEKKGEKTF